MANKLYPPQLAGSLPAFYKTYNKSTQSKQRNSNYDIPFSVFKFGD